MIISRAAPDPGGVMPSSTTASDRSDDKAPERSIERTRRPQKKKEPRRWLREVKAILLLALAGFGGVAVWNYTRGADPQGPVGHLGSWLGWSLFEAFGYGGFLFPLILAVVGVNVFVRPIATRGWTPFAGLAVLLLSASGLLTQTSTVLS